MAQSDIDLKESARYWLCREQAGTLVMQVIIWGVIPFIVINVLLMLIFSHISTLIPIYFTVNFWSFFYLLFSALSVGLCMFFHRRAYRKLFEKKIAKLKDKNKLSNEPLHQNN
ncbi:MAG: hypothetical protein V4490_08295 [Pseudomonadota bacterium]